MWSCPWARKRSPRSARPHIAETIASPEDLLQYQLIQSDNKQVRWPSWFALNGTNLPSSLRGSRFDRSFLAIAAAADGLGIALESTLLAEREILSGRLVAPLAGKTKDIRYVGHYLVFPKPSRQSGPDPGLRAMARARTRNRARSPALSVSGPGNDESDSRFLANNSFVALDEPRVTTSSTTKNVWRKRCLRKVGTAG